MKRAHDVKLIRRGWARVDALAERVRTGEVAAPDPRRTAQWLAGDLPGERGDDEMAGQAYVPVRLPEAVVERVDALLERLTNEDAGQALGRMSRSAVLRLVLLRGLAEIENGLSDAERADLVVQAAKVKDRLDAWKGYMRRGAVGEPLYGTDGTARTVTPPEAAEAAEHDFRPLTKLLKYVDRLNPSRGR